MDDKSGGAVVCLIEEKDRADNSAAQAVLRSYFPGCSACFLACVWEVVRCPAAPAAAPRHVIERGPQWTNVEEEQLICFMSTPGDMEENWRAAQAALPNRSPESIRQKWRKLKRRGEARAVGLYTRVERT